MKYIAVALVFFAVSLTVNCQTDRGAADRGAAELAQGVELYRAKKFAEAQTHFERAYALDPKKSYVQLFVARAIDSQYDPDNKSATNLEQGRRAIAAYQRFLKLNPTNDEAFLETAQIYDWIGDAESRRAWVEARAKDESFSAKKRAGAYYILMLDDWKCSYRITGPYRQMTGSGHDQIVSYKKWDNRAGFERAQGCVKRGLNEADAGLRLAPGDANCLTYKSQLLREAEALAEMDDKLEEKAELAKQADAAAADAKAALALNANQQDQPAQQAAPDDPVDLIEPPDRDTLFAPPAQDAEADKPGVDNPAPKPEPAWREFSPAQDEFTVSMPADVNEGKGEWYARGRNYSASDGGIIYLIIAADRPESGGADARILDIEARASAAAVCDAYRRFAHNSKQPASDCRADFVRQIDKTGFPGREYRITRSGKPLGVQHIYLFKSHMDILFVLGPASAQQVDRFMESFRSKQ
jgi:hypothetical protein